MDASAAREIAIACEDIVHGSVAAVDASGVTVAYTLEDGTAVQGVIPVAELLAPAALVAGDDDAVEQDGLSEYVEVDSIDPAAFYKVRCSFWKQMGAAILVHHKG